MKKTNLICLLISTFLICNNITQALSKHIHPTSTEKSSLAGSPGDKHIKYFGRWDHSDPSQHVSYWGGSYFKVNFSGTTVKIKVGNKSNFYAKIDNGNWISYLNTSGTIDLTTVALPNSIHSLTVAQGKDYDYIFNFQGLILDNGATTSRPSIAHYLIEYIGDSITTGYTDAQANVSDYGWVASELLGTEHTQIAYPGVNLVSGYKGPGMDVQYFKAQSIKYPLSLNWSFSVYKPRIIVINLGTNDNANKVPDSLFREKYIEFLSNIRSKYPHAEIFVMRTFLGLKEIPTQAAVNMRIAAGDHKLHYINTTGWLIRKSADYNDGVHPSINGHIKVAKQLALILTPYLH